MKFIMTYHTEQFSEGAMVIGGYFFSLGLDPNVLSSKVIN